MRHYYFKICSITNTQVQYPACMLENNKYRYRIHRYICRKSSVHNTSIWHLSDTNLRYAPDTRLRYVFDTSLWYISDTSLWYIFDTSLWYVSDTSLWYVSDTSLSTFSLSPLRTYLRSLNDFSNGMKPCRSRSSGRGK